MLAEYIDGGLEPRERANVETHLADCGECYENFAETVRMTSTAASPAAVAPASDPSRRRLRPYVYLAAAAAVVIAVMSPELWRTYSGNRLMGQLVETVGTERFIEARLDEPFLWGPRPAPLRGTDTGARASSSAATALRALVSSPSDGPAEAKYRAGVGAIALNHNDEGLSLLSEAAAAAPGDRKIAAALAAALIEQFRIDGQLSHLDRAALVLGNSRSGDSTAIRFNRALALELRGQRDAALQAWKDYVANEADPSWRAEGQAHIDRLGSLTH